jgi:hypothetical protein
MSWGTGLAEFKTRFPKHVQENGQWITGEGIEELAGTWMTVHYTFNKHDRLSTVTFVPGPADRERLLSSLIASLGQPAQEKEEMRFWHLPSRNVLVSMMVGNGMVAVIHEPLSGD